MSWLDDMRPATFRGVKFHVESAESSGGRRGPLHEFPFSEKPPVKDDTGKKARAFTVEGHLIGDDFLDQRDALVAALEQPGAGELNHPYFGVRVVSVETFHERHSSSAGGMVTLSIEFAEVSNEVEAGLVAHDAPAAALIEAASTVERSAVAGFADAVPTLAVFTDDWNAVTASLTEVTGKVQSALAAAAVPSEMLANFGRSLELPALTLAQFATPAEYIANLTASYINSAGAALAAGGTLVADPVRRMLALYGAVTVGDSGIEEALSTLVQRAVLASASQILLTQTFASYDDAIRARRAVLDAINAHTEDSVDDTYADFVDLRVAIAAAIPGTAGNLPRLQRYSPPETIPSLVVAFQLYGDVTREPDIVTRNKLRAPAFVLGDQSLEVLSYG